MRKERKAFSATNVYVENKNFVKYDEDPETLWRDGRLFAVQLCDVYAPAISALTPVRNDNIPTMCVDKYYRVYFNANKLFEWKDMAEQVSKETPCHCGATEHHPLAYIAGVIYHEAQHPLRRHHLRAESLGVNKDSARRWNYATDCEINDEAIELFQQLFKDKNPNTNSPGIPLICLPPGVVLPSHYELPDHLSAEEYYYQLPEVAEGAGSLDGCGSGCTGQEGSWELGPPSDQSPGVSHGDAIYIQKDVSKNIIKAAGRGIGALNSMLDWAKSNLPKSQYNWRKEMAKVMRCMVSRLTFGFKRSDYTRLHKDSAAVNYNVIYTDKVGVDINLAVIMDGSGSMGFGNRARQAVAELQKIIKTARAKVTFFMGDTEAGELQEVKSLAHVKFTGGGGTSMKRVVSQSLVRALQKRKKKPNMVILITDGETDWPSKEDMMGIPLLICIVNENKKVSWGDPIPSWAKAVWIPTGEVK